MTNRRKVETLALMRAASTGITEKENGQVYGIIDPDYGRIYTMVRKLAWEEGYAIGLHGSFTRDLDLIAVPWAGRHNCNPEKLVARILQATGLTEARPGSKGNPGEKPYGRLVWTLLLPDFGDPRFVDLSIMPAASLNNAASDVLAERTRQVDTKDWDAVHDDAHPSGEIAAFAALYAMPSAARDWPATDTGYGNTFGAALCPVDWFPKFGDRRRELVKAGALILAEIERLDRAAIAATKAVQ
jgi:hypothetical protein